MAVKEYMLLMAGLLLMISVMTAGCEEDFNPIQVNDRYHFSISGYLDASADSQWVRVTAVRDSLFLEDSKASIDAVVTLEDLESGETVTMKDSLHHYVDNHYAFNFVTTMDIEQDKAYRLTAERSDGMTSSATVTLPPEFPDPEIRTYDPNSWSRSYLDTLDIQNVKHLSEVELTYYLKYRGEEISRTFYPLKDTVSTPDPSTKRVIINLAPHLKDFRDTYCPFGYIATDRQIRVSSAGPDWRYPARIDDDILALPDGLSNIENGTGYLIGIINKRGVPYLEGLEIFEVTPRECPNHSPGTIYHP